MLNFHFLLLPLFEQGEHHFGCDSAQIAKFSNSALITVDILLRAAEHWGLHWWHRQELPQIVSQPRKHTWQPNKHTTTSCLCRRHQGNPDYSGHENQNFLWCKRPWTYTRGRYFRAGMWFKQIESCWKALAHYPALQRKRSLKLNGVNTS